MSSQIEIFSKAPPFVKAILYDLQSVSILSLSDLAKKEFDQDRVGLMALIRKYDVPKYETIKFRLEIGGFSRADITKLEDEVFNYFPSKDFTEDDLRILAGTALKIIGKLRIMNTLGVNGDPIPGFERIMSEGEKEKKLIEELNKDNTAKGLPQLSLSEFQITRTIELLESKGFNPHPLTHETLLDFCAYAFECVRSNGLESIYALVKKTRHPYAKLLLGYVALVPRPEEVIELAREHRERAKLSLVKNEIDQDEFVMVITLTIFMESLVFSLDEEIFRKRVKLSLASMTELIDGMSSNISREAN